MVLTFLDWTIIIVVFVLMVLSVSASKYLMKGVADFLAANRSAGRYLVSIASGVAGLGAITVVGNLEMNLVAGFSMAWWGLSMSLIIMVVTVSGWVIYRFRQTRSLTLAQFFEVRYSRKFRIFAGMIGFLSGIINMGIFPAVGARFFIHFCGLPSEVMLLGFAISTFPLVMLILLSVSIYFVFSGGQIAVIIADFFQGAFVNAVFLLLIIYMFFNFDWSTIQEALTMAPENASLINPFKTSHVKDFNFWFFLIGVFGFLYGTMSWQGTQAYNSSAKSAHEAKMGGVIGFWRGMPQGLLFLFIPIIAYTVLNHPDFKGIADSVALAVSGIESEAVQNQLKVPLVLQHLLPSGMIGAFVAVMLAAFISTHDTYLHSWGVIFIQDVVMPFRKKPLDPKKHIKLLRLAIVGVAVFIFFFSLFFQQSEYIFLFFAITGAIFAGGSGAVIIGGLYWKKGTTAAAWAAMISGSSIAVGGIIIHQVVDDFFINGQMFWAIAMFVATLIYVTISLIQNREYDLDKLLNRGKHARKDEIIVVNPAPEKGWKVLGIGKEFTKFDKVIYIANYAWTGGWTIIFIVGTIMNLTNVAQDGSWMNFWKYYLIVHVGLASFTFFWIVLGGFRDLKRMVTQLKKTNRDPDDDGFVSNI
ncbi:MAG: sodium:solute symporter [Calditrichaeota bacterium]|jgi:solute:Na+ symporter, SSS family|nr:sodium:solute symporter [Calditrichota bacterium]MBT7788476.1 sodium:solute symporter [Calditrichota bacterium]